MKNPTYTVILAPADLLFGQKPGATEPPDLATRVLYRGEELGQVVAVHQRERMRILACINRDAIYVSAPRYDTLPLPAVWNWQSATLPERIHAIGLDRYDATLPPTWIDAALKRGGVDPVGHVVWKYVPGDTRATAHARAVSPVGLEIVARMSH